MKSAEKLKTHICSKSQELLSFSEIIHQWNLAYQVQNTRRKSVLYLKATKPFTGADFENCTLCKDNFVSLLGRSTSFKIKGTPSKTSDLLMGNSNALSLLMYRKGTLELIDRSIVFSCHLPYSQVNSVTEMILEFHAIIKTLQDGDVLKAR